jgi:hypothetical protein
MRMGWLIQQSDLIPVNINLVNSRKPGRNGAFQIIDNSRLSTEGNAPLFQHRMTGTTFVSIVDFGCVNLLRVHFYLIYTFFL